MLTRLNISNYALIDHVEITFNKGLTIITGETGAGKSIIMGALSLILGERADVKSIRDKNKKTVIEATFDVSRFDLQGFFEANDIDYYPNECILRKELSDNGRSRAFVNDSPVPISVMKELTINLVDIHSQHSNLLLSKPAYQLSVLDCLACNKALQAEYASSYKEYRSIASQLNKAMEDFGRNKSEEDYIRFQLQQLVPLKLQPGEDVALEAEQKQLSNLTDIKENLWQAENLLNGEDNGILGQLLQATKSIGNVSEYVEQAKEYEERMQSALIELKDVCGAISNMQEGLDYNPERLEQINDRLNTIYSLETKHGLRSVDELIELQHGFEEKIKLIDNSDENIEALKKSLQAKENECRRLAAKLTESRKAAAKQFSEAVMRTCSPLGLKNIVFDVAFEQVGLGANGADAVKYMVAFNKNQALMPVETTASGGELSRLMLSIKAIIAKRMNLPTIIFDEVDTGVSGDVADKIGEMMSDMSGSLQVIAITHLPQVASRGDNHIKVYKTDVEDSTITSVKMLTADERINEVAAMLSGSVVTQSAIENAKSLLKNKL
ncbi:MAG: DNA repair protein RecN [Muribaculaceae bacterium]